MKLTVIVAMVLLSGLAARAETDLFGAVRNNDADEIKRLIRSGVDPNSRNYAGATALMYAAGFSTPECVRLLLDSGAAINATSNLGATALMWSTGDTSKVRVLIERGAEVNAQATDGTTALVSAALRGNVDAMRLLIAHGADPKISADELLQAAYRRESPDMRRLLVEAGVELRDVKQLGVRPLGSNVGNPGVLRGLLDAGADPNEGTLLVTVKVPVLGFASSNGSAGMVRTLIEHGADPNRPDTRKRTPLMMAASRTVPDTTLVRFLINKATDINVRDAAGRTALDWALTQGETQVAGMLRDAGGHALAQPTAAPKPVGRPRNARGAIEKALDVLLPASVASYEHWKCESCHNQSLPAMAAKVAASQGVEVHGYLGGQHEYATISGPRSTEEDLMLGRGPAVGYQMLALAERGVPANFVTDAMVHHLVELQRADGSWQELDLRPPLASGTIHPTAMAIRALSAYAPPGMRQDINAPDCPRPRLSQ